jgi:predicted transcriptional regulator
MVDTMSFFVDQWLAERLNNSLDTVSTRKNLLHLARTTNLIKMNGSSTMTARLELLMQQVIQLDRDERLELITHLANSLHSDEQYSLSLALTDEQKAQLRQLQAEIDLGLEDIKAGRVHDGETVFADLQQKIDRYRQSSLVHEICIEQVGKWNLFKFSESLQHRMEVLLEKKKADQLVPEEVMELDTIGELDRIFTHINAMVAAQDVDSRKSRVSV